MSTSRWLLTAILGLLISACSGMHSPPSPEVRQALAPDGVLRVGVLPGRPWSMLIDSGSGETRGVGYELGKELAERLGVPFELAVFSNSGQFVEALRAGQADVILSNATPARAKDVDFSPPVLEIEQAFLIRAGSPASTLAEVDRTGVRVGVSVGSSSEAILSREFKNATLARVPTVKGAIEMLAARTLDVFASNKATLFEMIGELPGARVLEGRYGVEHMALGIPKGRGQGMAYLRQFAEEVRAGGLVEQAVRRAGMSGSVKLETQ